MSSAVVRPLWWDQAEIGVRRRVPLDGRSEAEVVIVGGGFSGLWTAYYLAMARPGLRIVVLEAEHVGFGASGRNGGWCSALLPTGPEAIAREHGVVAARALHAAMVETVAEIARVTDAEGIDCSFHQGGYLHAARSEAQRRRLVEELEQLGRLGIDGGSWLDSAATARRIAVPGMLGAVWSPDVAVVHPAKLVVGLARAAEARGVTIHEDTRVQTIQRGRVECTNGAVVDAAQIVRATEAYTARLPRLRRRLVPIYSLMIATEPLPASVWDEIGWGDRCTFNDARRMIVYAQRTADDRIALGGRGAPYHWGSRVEPGFDLDPRVHRALADTLAELFPAASSARITHRWGGALGIARDWHASVGYDASSRIGWAGGYVGDGVATTNLAGRTLAALLLGEESPLTHLAWVGHVSPNWEPEPLRWAAISGAIALTGSVDRSEARGRTPRIRNAVLGRLTGG